MNENVVLIVVRADGIEINPGMPRLIAAVEPLKIAIDWSGSEDAWQSVRIGGFTRVDGSPAESEERGVVFRAKDKNIVQSVNFRFLENEDVLAHCEVTATPKVEGKSASARLQVWLLTAQPARRPGRPPAAEPRPPATQTFLEKLRGSSKATETE